MQRYQMLTKNHFVCRNNHVNNNQLEKNYFLNVAANDLKAPLEKITEKINSIKQTKTEDSLRDLSEILLESSYMQNIISDLLTINELDTAK